MKMFVQKYFNFLICILLYFNYLENVFCYDGEDNYLRSITSLFSENKNFITRKIHSTNRSYNSNKVSSVFNVLKFGAKGDGHTDDKQAFESAWYATCKVNGGVMLVPSGFTFLLQPVIFQGNCQPNVVVQVDGKIVAPPTKSDWEKTDFQWILFDGLLKGLTIRGQGVIDGFGKSWWDDVDFNQGTNGKAPYAIRIAKSVDVIVSGITIQNSPSFHIFIDDCQNVRIIDFSTSSPGDSPNTDGIHVSRSRHVLIYESTLACGDDCVSIQTGSSDVRIENVNCNPGHGYSIGGLGPPEEREAEVNDIFVVNSTVQNSLTGVRIKTWPGSFGSVNNVTFSNIKMSNVKTAISVDQNYCGGPKECPQPNRNAVAISNVMYRGIMGTFIDRSVSLVCSKYKPCRDLTFADIDLSGSGGSGGGQVAGGGAFCSNAYGKVLTKTIPPLDRCLLPDYLAPANGPTTATVTARV